MKKFAPALALAAMVVMLGGIALAAEDEKEKKPCNVKCPISGEAVDAEKTSTVKVEFCCTNCQAKFDKEPGKFLEKVAKAEKGKCIISGQAAAESSDLVVAFCCGNCKAKFDKEPKEFIAKVKIPEKKDQ